MVPGRIWWAVTAGVFVGLLLWFGKVLRLMRERKRMVDSAAGQLEVCRDMAANARGDAAAAAILERSRCIYRQAVDIYNRTLGQLWVYPMAILMGFRPIV